MALNHTHILLGSSFNRKLSNFKIVQYSIAYLKKQGLLWVSTQYELSEKECS